MLNTFANLQNHKIIPFQKDLEKKKGKGFYYHGIPYVSHSGLGVSQSAFYRLSENQKIKILGFIVIFISSLIINWHTTFTLIIAALTLIYFSDLLFNLFLICRSFVNNVEYKFREEELEYKYKWPKYTVLCPLYHEKQVLGQFVSAMKSLDYPKSKLQILLILEESDKETINCARKLKLPPCFQILKVPESNPRTKPKALNYGLLKATGEYVTIYDAEDIPEPKQLKKAVIAFRKHTSKLGCVQAKLNFYNPYQNILTRIFTAEYALWFDLILSGLQSINAPIPLGGTSNHFRLKTIRELSGWDAFNVTEDCDLGMRLAKAGYQTSLIDSITLEEANSSAGNWINQRTRWIKGYIQTYLVHIRNLYSFTANGNRLHPFVFHLIVGGKVISTFINPLMWIMTFIYFAFRARFGTFIESFFPAPVLYLSLFSLVFGNFLYLYYYMIGCARRGQMELVKYAYLVPFYWLGMSLSAWNAVYQILVRPYHWAKTVHGLHLVVKVDKREEIFQARIRIFIEELTSKSKAFRLPQIAQSISVLMIASMIGNFLNFLFNAYLGRNLGFEEFGLITVINSLFYILSIALIAINATFSYRVGFLNAKTGKGGGDRFYLSNFYKLINISLVVTLIWILVLPKTASFLKLSQSMVLLLFTPAITFGILLAVIKGYLNGNFYFKLISLLILIEAGTKFALGIILFKLHFSAWVFMAIPFSTVASFATALIIYKRLHVKSANKITYGFPRRFFAASVLMGISSTAFLTLDVVMVKHFMTPLLSGEYALLALIGKMIFFFGSIPNVFIIPFTARDEGKERNPIDTFYKLYSLVTVLVVSVFIFVGPLGSIFVPLLFGDKTDVLLPYLTPYSLTIALFTLSNSLVVYHLSRRQYLFSFISIFMLGFMVTSIAFSHQSIASVIGALLTVSIINFTVILALHLLQRKGKFILRNLIDLIDVFFPLPKREAQGSGKSILIFNWRDIKHSYAGGAEVYIHELSKRWVNAGHAVTIFCGNDGLHPRCEIIDGVEIIRRGGFYFVYVWAFIYYLFHFRGRFDLIIDSQNGIPFFTPLYVKEPVFSLMYHVHQEVFRKSLVWLLSAIAAVLENRAMPWIYRNTKFITVSDSTKEEMQKLGISASAITIIYPGVDLSVLGSGTKSKKPTVLYLGRLKYYKGIETFINTAEKIVKEIPNAKFIIAGDGEERENLIKLVKNLKLEGKIKFLGRVSEREKVRLYQRAWVFVNPSMMEGWGITTLEANACGTPVVAANVPGLRDSVRNPSSGFLVPHGDSNAFAQKIQQLIENDRSRAQMSYKAMIWAKKFDWEKSANEGLKILSS